MGLRRFLSSVLTSSFKMRCSTHQIRHLVQRDTITTHLMKQLLLATAAAHGGFQNDSLAINPPLRADKVMLGADKDHWSAEPAPFFRILARMLTTEFAPHSILAGGCSSQPLWNKNCNLSQCPGAFGFLISDFLHTNPATNPAACVEWKDRGIKTINQRKQC